MVSCVDAQADEIYENIVPEKGTEGNSTNNSSSHNSEGPLGGG
jgi:hypothetical protein